MTTPAIRAALDRLVNTIDGPVYDVIERLNAIAAARAALAAEPVEEGASERIISIAKTVQDCAFSHEPDARLIGNVCAEDVADMCAAVLTRWARPTTPPPLPPDYIDPEHHGEDRELLDAFYRACAIEGGTADEMYLRAIRAVRAARFAALAAPETPAEALAARPLVEQVARLADRIGAHTVGQITALSNRAAAWLRQNPPGQPVAIEPPGCPTPGACSCVEPPASPAPEACLVGICGSAFDLPTTKRAYTYAKQPGNVAASKLGAACAAAAAQSAGDSIDRGLALLQKLQNQGFGVFTLGAEYTTPEEGEVAVVMAELRCAAASYSNRGFSTDARRCRRAYTLLEQLSAPAPAVVAVAVAERLPGEGDCAHWPNDEEGNYELWCWQLTFDDDGWEVMQASVSRLTSPFLGPDGPSHWLPARAISLPQAGEVEA